MKSPDKKSFKHGMNRTRIHCIFKGIIYRCQNKKYKNFKMYGGRGIKCLWKDFVEFYKDMGDLYEKHVNEFGVKDTTIDRINVDGNYCKENCRWATRLEQTLNRRCSTGIPMLTIRGETKPLSEWSKEMNVYFSPKNLRAKLLAVTIKN